MIRVAACREKPREAKQRDPGVNTHDPIRSTITVHYPFHPHHGLVLEVVCRPRSPGESITVIDPSGAPLKIPDWMVSAALLSQCSGDHCLSCTAGVGRSSSARAHCRGELTMPTLEWLPVTETGGWHATAALRLRPGGNDEVTGATRSADNSRNNATHGDGHRRGERGQNGGER